MKTLVVHAHPDPDSYNAALFRAACESLREAGHEVREADLYALGFNPVMDRDERRAYLDNPGFIETRVQWHVDALRWAEHLVFVHPTWYYGPPAMLKGWLERVFLPGVAFLPPARKGATVRPGLGHIRALTVVTTGGAPAWFLWVIGNPHRRLFTRALGMLFARGYRLTWLQLHSMNNVTLADRERFLARVRRTLGSGTHGRSRLPTGPDPSRTLP